MTKSKGPTPQFRMTSTELESFVIGLAEPDDAERLAMAEVGRQPGATGLNAEGKIITVR